MGVVDEYSTIRWASTLYAHSKSLGKIGAASLRNRLQSEFSILIRSVQWLYTLTQHEITCYLGISTADLRKVICPSRES
ncbi:hypothetical protein ANAPH1_00848 [Anaplasma phagocytophilum]|nr:hypothetical protein ANAPH2_00605 [Anaplasma phagocytophilum]SCV65609.1 hypothetical protein ANAPH1_00848 [Anaplasma phagocytophilum]